MIWRRKRPPVTAPDIGLLGALGQPPHTRWHTVRLVDLREAYRRRNLPRAEDWTESLMRTMQHAHGLGYGDAIRGTSQDPAWFRERALMLLAGWGMIEEVSDDA